MRPLSKEEEASVTGGRTYRTPAGNTVKFNASLSDAQAATLGQIVDYGKAHNMLAPEIRMAVNQAFYESSLGSMTSNPSNPSVQGLYQYDPSAAFHWISCSSTETDHSAPGSALRIADRHVHQCCMPIHAASSWLSGSLVEPENTRSGFMNRLASRFVA